MEERDRDILCKHCGQPGRKHGSAQNPVRAFACPGSNEEPKWPKMKDDKKAGALYDKRLMAHWKRRKTSYERVAW